MADSADPQLKPLPDELTEHDAEMMEIPATEQEIQEAISHKRESLRRQLEPFAGVPYEVYEDKKCGPRGPLGMGTNNVEGRPKYYSLLKEADYLSQFALSVNADVMVFYDKSARGVGLLVNKVLPVVALEKAQKEGADPKQIKIPDIKFFNSKAQTILHTTDKAGNNNLPLKEYYQSVIDGLGLKAGQTVVFYDEASGLHHSVDSYSFVEPDGSEPHRWDQKAISEKRALDSSNPGLGVPVVSPSLFKEVLALRRNFPEIKMLGYIGGDEDLGGLDKKTRKNWHVQPKKLLGIQEPRPVPKPDDYPEQEPREGVSEDYNRAESVGFTKTEDEYERANDLAIINQQKIFVEKADISVTEEITQQREQLRREQSRMAWELFQQLILHKDPYVQPPN